MRPLLAACLLTVGTGGCAPDFDPLDPSLGAGGAADGGGSASGASSSTGGSNGTGATGTGAGSTGGNTGTGGSPVGNGMRGDPCDGGGDCTSGFCVDGVCCESACDQLCAVCAGQGNDGTCGPAPKFSEEPGCEGTQACGGGTIESCKLQAGQPCQNNGQCLNMCDGGTCD